MKVPWQLVAIVIKIICTYINNNSHIYTIMSTYGHTHWMSLASKIKENEGLTWDDAQEEAKKRLKVGQYREKQSRSQPRDQPRAQPRVQPRAQPRAQPRVQPRGQPRDPPRAQPRDPPRAQPRAQPRDQPRAQHRDQYRIQSRAQLREPALIEDVENIMALYADPETYGILMQYNPQKYTLAKYEHLIAASESRVIQENLDKLEENYEENFETTTYSDYTYDKGELLMDSIDSILEIMQNLQLIETEYLYDEGGDGRLYWFTLPIKLLQKPKGMEKIDPLPSYGKLYTDNLTPTFIYLYEENGTVAFPTPLSPLWQLLYDTVQYSIGVSRNR